MLYLEEVFHIKKNNPNKIEEYLVLKMGTEELKVLISEVVREELEKLKAEKPKTNKLLTRKEVAEKLKISLVTLSSWTKDGLIPAIKMGSRVYYQEGDLEKTIEGRKLSRYRRY